MMVTANQLHVSAPNRPSSGCTPNEKGCTIYNVTEVTLYIVQPSALFIGCTT